VDSWIDQRSAFTIGKDPHQTSSRLGYDEGLFFDPGTGVLEALMGRVADLAFNAPHERHDPAVTVGRMSIDAYSMRSLLLTMRLIVVSRRYPEPPSANSRHSTPCKAGPTSDWSPPLN
jgi:hypothetical protein